jgi:hypothetical protein
VLPRREHARGRRITLDDGSEIVIQSMRMRAKYELFLRGEGDSDA